MQPEMPETLLEEVVVCPDTPQQWITAAHRLQTSLLQTIKPKNIFTPQPSHQMEFIPTAFRMVAIEDAGNLQDLRVVCGN